MSSHSSKRCWSISRASRTTKSINSWSVGTAFFRGASVTMLMSHPHRHELGPRPELMAHRPLAGPVDRHVGLFGFIGAVKALEVHPLIAVRMQAFLRPLIHFEVVMADDRRRRIDQPVVHQRALQQHVGP